MRRPLATFDIRVDFEGFVPLMARRLYRSPDAFVRELLQNAADAIRRRRERSPRRRGRIDVEIRPVEGTIVFTDDGVGMREPDIRRLLSVIGASGTRKAAEEWAREDPDAAESLIGRFGTGLLSAFIVAERVEVRTRCPGARRGWRWENERALECTLRPVEMERAGTEVTLQIAAEHESMLDEDTLRKSIIRYAEFLPVPIFLNGVGPQNAVKAPWDRPRWSEPGSRRATLRRFAKERSGSPPLEVIPVDFEVPVRAKGVLYVRPANKRASAATLELYVQRMFVSQLDRGLLPPWAHFVDGVIECPDLELTAGRASVRQHGPAFGALRDRLGALLLDSLGELAEREPQRFSRLGRQYASPLKAMAMLDPAFFARAADLLLVPSDRGMLCLRELLVDRADGVIQVRTTAAGEVDATCAPGAGAVLVLRDPIDEAFVKHFADRNPRRLELVPVEDAVREALFVPLPDDEAREWSALADRVAETLAVAGLGETCVCMQHGGAEGPPALLRASAGAERDRRIGDLADADWVVPSLAATIRETVIERSHPIELWLNVDHAIIRELREPVSPSPSLDATYVGLALSAILERRSLLTDRLASILQGSLARLLVDSARDLARAAPPPGLGGS
jgi:molecular chaperone HtpG